MFGAEIRVRVVIEPHHSECEAPPVADFECATGAKRRHCAVRVVSVAAARRRTFGRVNLEVAVRKSIGEKKKPCKNCEGKGTLKKGDKIVRCQRCGGTGIKPS